MADAALIQCLKQSEILRPLANAQLEELVKNNNLVVLEPDQPLFKQGGVGDCAYIVVKGSLKVQSEFSDTPSIVGHVHTGELVGEIAVFAQTPRNATLIADEPTQLLQLPRDTLVELVHKSPILANRMISQLGHHLDELNTKVAGLTTATKALCEGNYDPSLLSSLKQGEDKLGYLASLFEALADEIVEKRTRTHEMQTAIDIQQSFLPAPFEPAPESKIQLAAIMQPARHVGGDFYDYFFIDDTRFAVLIGDVSGKGVPAALFMSMCATTLKTLLQSATDPGDVLHQMNHIICKDNDEAMFVTIFLAIIDTQTGNFDYASAGHEDVFIKSENQTLTQFKATGPAIGLMDTSTYETQSFKAQNAYQFLLTTDGISEAFDGDGNVFGTERLLAFFNNLKAPNPQDALDALMADLQSHVQDEPPSDDVTAVMLHFQDGSLSQ